MNYSIKLQTQLVKYNVYLKLYLLWILFLSLISCNNTIKEENTAAQIASNHLVELTEAQAKNAAIQLAKAEEKSIPTILKVNGIIDVPPQNMVSISVPLGGYLKSTNLLEGMHVRKGEIIATLEDQQYIQLQQDYLTAKSHLVAIEKEYERQSELNKSKAGSDKNLELAVSNYQSQKVTVKALAEKLKLININPNELSESNLSRSIQLPSPIDGYVKAIHVNIGKYVSPTEVLFELVNPEDIHLALTVFEKDIDKLAVGQKLTAYSNQQPGKKYTCEIILIGKDISKERTLTIHCHFEKYHGSLIPGMYMNAAIEVENSKALVLPSEAIVRFEGKEYVFCEQRNLQFQMTEVMSGTSTNGFTQIKFTDTAAVNSRNVVVKGAYTLLMKLKNKDEE